MATNKRRDRYDYVYGNNAVKVQSAYSDYQSTSPRKESALPKEKVKKRPQRERSVQVNNTFDLRYTMTILLAFAILAMAALFNINETSKMNDLSKQIKLLKTEKSELQSRQVSIQSEIDKAVNLDRIRQYAEENLGMVDPDHDDIIYYNQDSNDYFRQYESVDK